MSTQTAQAVRLKGVVLPEKHLWIALQAIYGVGPTRAKWLCQQAQLAPEQKPSQLGETALKALQDLLDQWVIEGDLKRTIAVAKKRLRDIRCYRGLRDLKKLPRRGQRTRTNARTCKGPRKAIVK